MITQLSYIFGSKTKAQEILLLLHDKKPVVRQGFYEPELARVETFCEKNGLTLVKSKFKVLLADETSYSNKGIKIQGDDKRPGMYFVYISKDEKQAWLASYYELMDNSADLGKTLGYPSCCVEFFIKRFTADNPNLQLSSSNIWTNLSKRGEDCVLLSHFPCSETCQESITVAQNTMDLLLAKDRERAHEMMELLKT